MTHEIDFRNEDGECVKRLVWLTDLHLDALDKAKYLQFLELLESYEGDAVLIGGDICNGTDCLKHLIHISKFIPKQFYFVLGNHDYYYGSIPKTRTLAHDLVRIHPGLHYLTDNGIIPLSKHTALIGHDGWADGREGDFLNSNIMLNDYFLIEELKRLNQPERLQKINQLGAEAAAFFKMQLANVFENYDRVVLLTHSPPFLEAAMHEGLPCDTHWAPHMVGKATGDVLKVVMQQYPNKHMLVLCGHTHTSQDVHILPNLHVVTGKSELGLPDIQGLIYVN